MRFGFICALILPICLAPANVRAQAVPPEVPSGWVGPIKPSAVGHQVGMAVAPGGTIHVLRALWIGPAGASWQLWYSRRAPGDSAWTHELIVPNTMCDAFPDLTLAPDGTLHGVYCDGNVGGVVKARHAEKPPGQGWTLMDIDTEGVRGISAGEHRIVLAADGEPAVAFRSRIDGRVFYEKRSDNPQIGWTGESQKAMPCFDDADPPNPTPECCQNHGRPSLALGPDGKMRLACASDQADPFDGVRVGRQDDFGQWIHPFDVVHQQAGGQDGSWPAVEVWGTAQAPIEAVAWHHPIDGTVLYSENDGLGWGAPVVIDAAVGGGDAGVGVDLRRHAATGRRTVLYSTSGGPGNELRVAYSVNPAAGFDPPDAGRRRVDGDCQETLGPELDLDLTADGDVRAAYAAPLSMPGMGQYPSVAKYLAFDLAWPSDDTVWSSPVATVEANTDAVTDLKSGPGQGYRWVCFYTTELVPVKVTKLFVARRPPGQAGWNAVEVDANAGQPQSDGRACSVAVSPWGADSGLEVAYWSDGMLKLRASADLGATWGAAEVLGPADEHVSLEIDVNGQSAIAYRHPDGTVHYTVDDATHGWCDTPVEFGAVPGAYPDLQFDPAQWKYPRIAWSDPVGGDLRVSWQDSDGCITSAFDFQQTLAGRSAGHLVLALTPAVPVEDVQLAWHDTVGGDVVLSTGTLGVAPWQDTTLDDGGGADVGAYLTGGLDANLRLSLSYYNIGASRLRTLRYNVVDKNWLVCQPPGGQDGLGAAQSLDVYSNSMSAHRDGVGADLINYHLP